MALFSRDKRPVKRDPGKPAPDPRIYGRHYRGPSPWVWGLIVAVIIGAGVYLAFAKRIPFTSEGFQLNAQFENATTLRETSPVRIAGVNVGKVTKVEREGDAVQVTFSVDEAGQPIHSDATVEIRPRLFLEGNFFLDLDPGSPSAPALDDGGDIPVTQTATAVQIDEVLSALQAPTRKNLQRALSGFGTALTYEPTAADDVGQDPDVAGETGAEALNQSLRYGGPAGRDTAIVNEALLGESGHDLSGLIRAQRVLFGRLEGHETELQGLITNFNVFAGRARGRVGQPERDDRRARADGRGGAPVAGGALRRAAAVPGAGDRAHPEHRGAAGDDRRGQPVAGAGAAAAAQVRARRPRPAAAQVDPAAGRDHGRLEGAVHVQRGLRPLRHLEPGSDRRHRHRRQRWRLSVRPGRRRRPGGRDQLPGVPLHPGQPGRHRPGLRRQRHLPAGQHRRRLGALEHGLSAGRLPQRLDLRQHAGERHSAPARPSPRPCRRTAPTSPATPTRCPTSTAPAAPACPATSVPRPPRRCHETRDPRTPDRLHRDRGPAGGGAGGDRLHPLPAAAAVPVLGADPRRRPVRGQGRALDRAGGHPGPGPDREHRRGQGGRHLRGRARRRQGGGDDAGRGGVRAAGPLRLDRAAAAAHRAPGHDARDRDRHRRAARRGLDDPALADRAQRAARPDPRHARRRHPRLPAAAAPGRRRRPRRQGQEALGDLQALRAALARPGADRRGARGAPRQHPPRDHHLQAGQRGARRQRHPALGVRRLLERRPRPRSPTRRQRSASRSRSCRARSPRPARRSRAASSSPTSSARRRWP